MSDYMSLKDHVYKYISEKINDGSLKPTDKLSEKQISDALDISRTPIREALIQLASEGLLEKTPRKGFKVKVLDIKKAQNLYEIIGLLDGKLAYNAVDLMNDDIIKKMQFLVESMDSAINQGLKEEYHELQLQFHDLYVNLSDNADMVSLLNQLKNNFLRKYYVFDEPNNEQEILRKTNKEHYEIIRLFKEKKKDELEKYLKTVHWVADNVKSNIF